MTSVTPINSKALVKGHRPGWAWTPCSKKYWRFHVFQLMNLMIVWLLTLLMGRPLVLHCLLDLMKAEKSAPVRLKTTGTKLSFNYFPFVLCSLLQTPGSQTCWLAFFWWFYVTPRVSGSWGTAVSFGSSSLCITATVNKWFHFSRWRNK